VVARAAPFQFTTELGTNWDPFTVRGVRPAVPAGAVFGTSGWAITGTGRLCMIATLVGAEGLVEIEEITEFDVVLIIWTPLKASPVSVT